VTLAIDLFILWFLVVIVAGNQPVGSLARRLLRPCDWVIDGIGLRQHWALFAPNPSAVSTRLYALIRLSSGGVIRWDPPRFDDSARAAWWGFRRHLFELMIATVGGSVARRSLASYLVQTYGRAGDAAVEVIFMRVETPVPAVSGGPCGPVVERMVEAVPVEPAHGAAVSAR
jgi:hypothetical protein